MHIRQALALLLAWMIFPAIVHAQPRCVAPPLSDQQVKGLIDKARSERSDVPRPFAKSRWVVKRQGCHYVYVEYAVPATPDESNIFRLNQYGVIVDVQTGTTSGSFTCPGKDLTDSDLAEIVRKEREKRGDLPPPFPDYKTRVHRVGCLYLYFEYPQPEVRGNYQVFTIDPLGELMEFSRSKPY